MKKNPVLRQPNLGRYDGIAQSLLRQEDNFRTFVEISDMSPTKASQFGVVDLFAGAGGMSLGFKQVGYELVSAVEIVEIAAETHRRNFPECDIYSGDIANYRPEEHTAGKKIRVVVGGPPCQGFSVAGKRDPHDPRNRLFHEFVRVVKEIQPDYFVMENVPGILTMQRGQVKEAILEAFDEIGYPNVSIAVLEAASYGIPQMRARAIFIGNRHGMRNPFPAPFVSRENYSPIERSISDLPAWERIPEINHEWTKHSKDFMSRISKVLPGESLYSTFYDAYKRQYLGVPSMTIKENHGGTHIHPILDRCISAREMARLQSFPDTFIFCGPMKKAMWQIGNAVPPRLAESIASAILPFLQAVDSDGAPEYSEWTPLVQQAKKDQMTLFL